MKITYLFTICILAMAPMWSNASVGFKKQSANSLLKKVPKERMLADSQQMLDAQDSRMVI
jgi:hypothetical protein